VAIEENPVKIFKLILFLSFEFWYMNTKVVSCFDGVKQYKLLKF